MLKAVIFDVDGTLCESYPLCIKAFQESIAHYLGRTPSEEEIKNTFGPEEAGTIRHFIPEHLCEGVELYTEIYASSHDDICPELFHGIKETLDFLKRKGVVLSLVTGKAEKSCEITLNKFSVSDYFDFKGFGIPDKPNKDERISEFLEKFSLSAYEAIYIGDSAGDVALAKKVGVKTISALWSKYADEQSVLKEEPYKVAYSVRELFTMLKNEIIV